MRIVSRPRQGGKTTELIRMAAERNICIVAPSVAQAKDIACRADRMGLKIIPPITWDNLLAGGARGRSVDYLIDNLDACLQRYVGPQMVVGASLSGVEIDVHQVPAG